jgi:hypothetical protein
MQFNTIDDHFVPYAESYEDSTFILILHHIQINVIPKSMRHVGTVKSMYLRQEKKRKKKYTCILCYCVLSYILSLNHLLLMSLCY